MAEIFGNVNEASKDWNTVFLFFVFFAKCLVKHKVLMLNFWNLQEPLVELANPSDTDIDIPANFD